jgi:hypothetical protein
LPVGSWQFSFSFSGSSILVGSSCDAKYRLAAKNLRTFGSSKADSGPILFGAPLALSEGMKELSPKRKRTLALQERTITFSVNVNACCPEHFSNVPSKTVWAQLFGIWKRAWSARKNKGGAQGAAALTKLKLDCN